MKPEKNKFKLLNQNNIKINQYLKTNNNIEQDGHQSVFDRNNNQQIQEKKIVTESL